MAHPSGVCNVYFVFATWCTVVGARSSKHRTSCVMVEVYHADETRRSLYIGCTRAYFFLCPEMEFPFGAKRALGDVSLRLV